MIKNEQWEYVHRFLVNVSNGYYQHPDNRKMSQLEAKVTLDVITELVHEIERLEELITVQTPARCDGYKGNYSNE